MLAVASSSSTSKPCKPQKSDFTHEMTNDHLSIYRFFVRDIHIENSWSPEYPGGRGQDINFTIALMRWSCQTLIDIELSN